MELRQAQHAARAAQAAQAAAEEAVRQATPERQTELETALAAAEERVAVQLAELTEVRAMYAAAARQVKDATDVRQAASARRDEEGMVSGGGLPAEGEIGGAAQLAARRDELQAEAATLAERAEALRSSEAAAAAVAVEAAASLKRGRDEIRHKSLELARIGARLQQKDETLRTGLQQVSELRRRLALAEAKLTASDKGAGAIGDQQAPRGVEGALLHALALECTLAVELSAVETELAEAKLTAQARIARASADNGSIDSCGGDADTDADGDLPALAQVARLQAALAESEAVHGRRLAALSSERSKDLLAVRHRCRAMVVERDTELARLRQQLASVQQQLVEGAEREQANARLVSATASLEGGSRPDGSIAGGMAWQEAGSGVAVEASVVGASGSTEATLLAKARQQAMHEAEVERWRSRAVSLEARLRGATEARRSWALREADLNEKLEQQSRLLQAHGRLENLEYLRNVRLASQPQVLGPTVPDAPPPSTLLAAAPLLPPVLWFAFVRPPLHPRADAVKVL